MNKSYMVVGAVALGLGFYTMYVGLLSQLLMQFSPLTTMLKQGVTQIYVAWTGLPQAVQSIILMGIPTLFAIFFAWTKTRAIQKLQETQQQATSQYTQLSGEKQSTETNFQALQAKYSGVTQEYEDYKGKMAGVEEIIANLKGEVTRQEQLVTQLTTERNMLERQVQGLQNIKVKYEVP